MSDVFEGRTTQKQPALEKSFFSGKMRRLFSNLLSRVPAARFRPAVSVRRPANCTDSSGRYETLHEALQT